MQSLLTSPGFTWLFLAFFVLPVLGLGGFLAWLVFTRRHGDMGLTKKANRFKDLDGFINEGKKRYRLNEELKDLYYVANKSGAKKKFIQGLLAAGERGGMSATKEEGALWVAQAIALDTSAADGYYRLGKMALEIGVSKQDSRYLRVAHQAFIKAFLLERGHVQAFENLITMSDMTDKLYTHLEDKQAQTRA